MLAVPYGAVGDVLARLDGQLDGKVVVDITNPVDFSTFEPLGVDAGSAAQQIAHGHSADARDRVREHGEAPVLTDGRVAPGSGTATTIEDLVGVDQFSQASSAMLGATADKRARITA